MSREERSGRGRLTEQLRDRLRDGERPPLALWVRILLMLVGWSLVLVGVAGLVLPGIQGILTILLGAAVLSVASESVYRLIRKLVHDRWPQLGERIDRFRHQVHAKLSRQPQEPADLAEGEGEGED